MEAFIIITDQIKSKSFKMKRGGVGWPRALPIQKVSKTASGRLPGSSRLSLQPCVTQREAPSTDDLKTPSNSDRWCFMSYNCCWVLDIAVRNEWAGSGYERWAMVWKPGENKGADRPCIPKEKKFPGQHHSLFMGSLPGTSTSRISSSHPALQEASLSGTPTLLQQMHEAFTSRF